VTLHSHWLWFHVAIVLLMAAEYLIHLVLPAPRRKAIVALAMWFLATLALAAWLATTWSSAAATQFLAGYAIEQALSIDNLLVFLLLFSLFAIPPIRQPRVLFCGILGAIILRGLFILAGVGLLERFHFVSYIFAAVLLFAAIKMLRPSENAGAGKTPRWIAWLSRVRPISMSTDHFLTKEPVAPGGPLRWMPTVLLLSLIAVELTDVVFALDSIPAVLSITRQPFLAYASNILAVMSLRSIYVLLASMLSRLRFLHVGLAVLLAFAAIKMLLADWIDIGPLLSLGIIAAVLAITVAASLLVKPNIP
jgi:tellurite resistance protein TerC